MKHSVIMPAYNAAAYIKQSVGSALSQLAPDDEIIIIDDGSTDATTEVVNKIQDRRVCLLSQTSNQGIAAARNRGLEVASGDYVHFLDHDDLWPPDRMAAVASVVAVVAGLDDEPCEAPREALRDPLNSPPTRVVAPDVISGWVAHFYCDSLDAQQRAQYHLPPPQAAALPGSVVIRRTWIEQAGMFDVTLSSGEFIDFLSRVMALNPKRVNLDQVLFLRRIHGRNHTLTDTTSERSYLKVVRRHLARRRATGEIES